MRLKHNGFSDPITLGLVAIAVCIGCYYMLKSGKIDAPAEQVAEAILKIEGVDIDFSHDKKQTRDNKADNN